jgi:energy-coupling factor transport system permease protein
MPDQVSLYAPGNSGLHHLHPLTKLSLAGFALLAGLTLPGRWGTYLLVALFLLPLAAWGGLAGRLGNAVWRIVLPFAVSVFVIQGLFWTGGTPVLQLGPLSVKAEGISFAIASTGRILTVVTAFLLLILSTRPDALMIALTERGLPPTITYIVLATIQIVPRFQARAQTIMDAQQSRGLRLEGSLIQRGRALIPLVVPLVLGSIVDVEQRAMALEARGFSRPGPKTSYLQLVDSQWQSILRAALIVLSVLAVVGRLALLIIP